jgi:hypothetical protein
MHAHESRFHLAAGERLRRTALPATVALFAAFDAAASHHSNTVARADAKSIPASYPPAADVIAPNLIREPNGVSVSEGYGSALSADPAVPRRFFLLCDRGPNVDTAQENHIAFLIPTFTPRIGCFQLEGKSLRQLGVIELKDEEGKPLSGMPPSPGDGGTGEVPEDLTGHALDHDSRGIDPEGLVALRDGTFWISEEYRPSLLHVDANGRTLDRIDPYGAPGHALPQVFRRRWPNRGIEGITVTPDGATLVAVMESPLLNPTKDAGKKSRVVRLFFLDTATGKTRQFIDLLDEAGIGNSDITALTATSFLVIERDKKRPADEKEPSRIKRLYRIDTADASDVSDPDDGADGLRVNGKTLEELGEADLQAAGIRPVTKTLVVDLLKLPGGYPHDKPEGVVAIGDRMVAISNDSDFGIDDDGHGGVVAKKLPAADGAIDRSQIYFIQLQQSMLP